MKKICMTLFLITILYCACDRNPNNPLNTNTINNSHLYYPLQLENKWIYNSNFKATMGDYHTNNEEYFTIIEVLEDTVMKNNVKYYKIKKYFKNSQNWRDKKYYDFQRVDNKNGKIFRFDNELNESNYEYLMEDLTVNEGDEVESHFFEWWKPRWDYYDKTVVLDVSRVSEFGLNTTAKTYKEIYYYIEHTYKLVHKLGLFYHKDVNDYYTVSEDLKGCVVGGQVYGDTSLVSTKPDTNEHQTGTMTDQDDNVYKTIKIGDQWWTAENLKVTHYRNGDPIPNVQNDSAWSILTTGSYCAMYVNDENLAEFYGYLYNWYAVNDSRNVAPEGWHVPTDDEWEILEMTLGMSQAGAVGSKLAGNADLWGNGTLKYNSAFGESGFSALPGGFRMHYNGRFLGIGSYACFWSSTENNNNYAWQRYLDFEKSGVQRDYFNKQSGLSVRLVKYTEPEPTIINIEVTPSMSSLNEGAKQQFTCTANYSDGSTKNASQAADWSISPTTTGSIDENGLYTAPNIYNGVVTITAYYEGYTDDATVYLSSIETGTMTGNDGKVYQTVKIGDQWWMAENLKETQYRNGNTIEKVTDNHTWAVLLAGARCAYENDESNADSYGYLYNWYAVNDSRNIAALGWHVPTDEEWKELEMALGMSQSEADNYGWRGTNEGSKLAGNASLWSDGLLENNVAIGESGFSVLPAGSRDYFNGGFGNLGYSASFWSSTEYYSNNNAWSRSLDFSYSGVYRYNYSKRSGFSIRLVRD